MAAPALTLLCIMLALAAAWPVRHLLGPAGAQPLGRVAEDLALKLLLPLVVVDALGRGGQRAGLVAAVALGLALPLLCLGIGFLVCSARRNADSLAQERKARLRDTVFLAASFGGGNRGTALLLLLTAASVGQTGLLAAFALVDLGNLLCLLFVVAPILRRVYGPSTSAAAAPTLWRTLAGSDAGVLVLVVVGILLLQQLLPATAGLLDATGSLRSAALTALVFFALALRWRPEPPLRGLLVGLAAFGLIRGLAALALLMLELFLPPPLLFSALVLLALPPSSLLPSLVAQTGADAATRDYIDRFATATNVLYLVVLLLAGVAAAGLAWKG